jgi:hypothetical protein
MCCVGGSAGASVCTAEHATAVCADAICRAVLINSCPALPCCPAVCPRGFYEPSADASSCVRCDAGSYCSGGDKVANPSSRGSRTECGANLVTRTTGARTAADCGEAGGLLAVAQGLAMQGGGGGQGAMGSKITGGWAHGVWVCLSRGLGPACRPEWKQLSAAGSRQRYLMSG